MGVSPPVVVTVAGNPTARAVHALRAIERYVEHGHPFERERVVEAIRTVIDVLEGKLD